MKNTVKRTIAGCSILAVMLTNSAFADLSLTGSTTGLSLTGATQGTEYSGSGVTGDLNVTVSAQVLPTLSFSISTGSLNLGVLDASSVSTSSLDISLSTNAADGALVSVSSTQTGGLTSAAGDVIDYTGSAIVAGTEGYNLTVDGATQTKGAISTINNATVATNVSTSIMSVNNPTDTAKVTVHSNASINSITPSGNYSITHVFSVTGTF